MLSWSSRPVSDRDFSLQAARVPVTDVRFDFCLTGAIVSIPNCLPFFAEVLGDPDHPMSKRADEAMLAVGTLTTTCEIAADPNDGLLIFLPIVDVEDDMGQMPFCRREQITDLLDCIEECHWRLKTDVKRGKRMRVSVQKHEIEAEIDELEERLAMPTTNAELADFCNDRIAELVARVKHLGGVEIIGGKTIADGPAEFKSVGIPVADAATFDQTNDMLADAVAKKTTADKQIGNKPKAKPKNRPPAT